MRTDQRAAAAAAGFTLIEVLVVLVIMGLTAAIFVTQGTTRHAGTDLRIAATSIAQGLRLARSQATATDRPVAFVVDVAAHTYRIGDAPARPLAPELAIAVTSVAGAGNGRAAAIGFAPDGSSTGGRVELSTGSSAMTVNVDWLTGGVRVVDAR